MAILVSPGLVVFLLLSLGGCITHREAVVVWGCGGKHSCLGRATLPTENVELVCTDGQRPIVPWSWLIGEDRGRR